MPDLSSEKRYRAAVYIRLSREDGDKEESNSVTNQREYIYAFIQSNPDISVECERIDDGYSGVTFDRPGFNQMLSDIRSGRVNCVVVKDLSRFGRNYIEAGRYLEHIFPFIGVRFIAINDGYDSTAAESRTDSILIPFKNLINDAYSRDISVKIRSQLEVRRKRGDFVGSFPVYGYFRSQDNKNQLVIDEYAANIIRDIFKWKINGFSNQKIADRLNDSGVHSPYEYKLLLQWSFQTSFKRNDRARWSAAAIGRILSNETYTGVLLQGKETTPNYKVKKRIKKPSADWIRIQNAHPPIISKDVFELTAHLIKADTRIAPGRKSVYPFSGILECNGCRGGMTRKKIKKSGNEYVYYICTANKNNPSICSSHRISETALENAVLAMLRLHGDIAESPEPLHQGETHCQLPVQLTENSNLSELNRRLLVTLVDKIVVVDSEKIQIKFKYRDDFIYSMTEFSEGG
jgi:Site-specific recombinases, DNA invertase Pin homologs